MHWTRSGPKNCLGDRHVVFAGDADWAVKDPVIMREPGLADGVRHPLAEQGHEDRITRYATSVDGLRWEDQGSRCVARPVAGTRGAPESPRS